MDCEDFDPGPFAPEALGVSRERLESLWAMLAREGYVEGVKVIDTSSGRVVALSHPRITLRGLEYMQTNSMMARAARLAKGIAEVV